jgi:pectinesterase
MRIMTRIALFLAIVGLSACSAEHQNINKEAQDYDAVVGGDAPNAFATVQAALDAAPKDEAERYRILVKPGRYKEKLNITRSNMEIKGEGAASTIIYFDAYAGNSRGYREDGWGTPGSATVSINATDIHVANLTIENTFNFLSNDAKKALNDSEGIADSQAIESALLA